MLRLLSFLILLTIAQDSEAKFQGKFKGFLQNAKNIFPNKSNASNANTARFSKTKNNITINDGYSSNGMPFAASGLQHSFSPNKISAITKINDGKNNWSRLISTKIKINSNNYTNPILGSYSSAYIDAAPKFKAYKFGQEDNEYEYLKNPKYLRPSKSSKSLIERFIEEDMEEEKAKFEDLSRKNVVQRNKGKSHRELGINSENQPVGLAIALATDNQENDQNNNNDLKDSKIVANKMQSHSQESQTVVEEPLESEEKTIENFNSSEEYYSFTNSEYYSANSENGEEETDVPLEESHQISDEEFQRSLTADQLKNKNKGKVKRFYSEQSLSRRKKIKERFDFPPKQRNQLNSYQTRDQTKIKENNINIKENISTKLFYGNSKINEKNKQIGDTTMISDIGENENYLLNNDQIKENKQLNKDKQNKRKNKIIKNPLGVNKVNGIKNKRQNKIRDRIHNILFGSDDDKIKKDLTVKKGMIKKNIKKRNGRVKNDQKIKNSEGQSSDPKAIPTKSKNKGRIGKISKGFKVKTKRILGGLKFGKKNKKDKTNKVNALKEGEVIGNEEKNIKDIKVEEENNNIEEVKNNGNNGGLNKNHIEEGSSHKYQESKVIEESSSLIEEGSSSHSKGQTTKVIEEVKVLQQNNILEEDIIQEEEEDDLVIEELLPKPSEEKIVKNEQFNKILEEFSPKTIPFPASPFRHIKTQEKALNTIWADYEFSPSLAIKEADMLTIVPLLFKAFEAKKHNKKFTKSEKALKDEHKILYFDPLKFVLSTVLKQAFKNRKTVPFDMLKEFFKNVELSNWAEIEKSMDIDKVDLLYQNYTDYEKLRKDKKIEIPIEKYKQKTEEEIKEYPIEDQYFWLIIKMDERKISFKKILEKKFVYDKKLIDAKKDIIKLKSELNMPNFDEIEKEFIEKIFKTALHIINLLNWVS